MCDACDNVKDLKAVLMCPCGGLIRWTGEIITTAAGPHVCVCRECKTCYHVREPDIESTDEGRPVVVPWSPGKMWEQSKPVKPDRPKSNILHIPVRGDLARQLGMKLDDAAVAELPPEESTVFRVDIVWREPRRLGGHNDA